MKNLFLIDGASGTGKSDLLGFLTQFSTDVAYVKKYTTRDERYYEKGGKWFLDLEFVNKTKFNKLKLEYHYLYSGFSYGFSKSDLDKQLAKHSNVFIIVRNIKIIKKLLLDYKYLNVVPIFIYTDRMETVNRLKRKKCDQKQIDFRLKRLEVAFGDYLKHHKIYEKVIINSASINEYHRLIEDVINEYRDAQVVDDKLVSIMMSFNPDNPNLEDYSNAIKDAVKKIDSSFNCINLEDIKGVSFKISDGAKDLIAKSRLVIIDLTENKPNVFYELGYAQGIGKDLIITCHESTKRQFYPSEYKNLRYKNASQLRNDLYSHLKSILK